MNIKKRQVRLELPSGVTIQQKISANMTYWIEEIEHRIASGSSMQDIEQRIQENIKCLASKIQLVVIN